MNVKSLSVALLLLFTSLSCRGNGTVKVQTPLGRISGNRLVNQYGNKYDTFLGIPYAQPPVGRLRFELPQPIRRWEYELQATKLSSPCTQIDFTSFESDKVSGCEDCLYLNVYVPFRNNSGTLLPVMIWIHGGGFQAGDGYQINPDSFPIRNVILVTFNYRLGPYGFLSTEDSVVPGNMGLKDQSMALRWVYRNIRSFGGNPKNITIFGYSAGGSSVHYHYLSPLSAGLFQRGAAGSGLAIFPEVLQRNASANANKLGAYLGCPTGNSTQLINCLRQVPPRVLSQATSTLLVWGNNPSVPFGFVVEAPGPNAFISRPPIDIINDGEAYDVPLLTGIVSQEGLYHVSQISENDTMLKQLNDNWTTIAPYLLFFDTTVPRSQQRTVAQKIRRYYLGSNKINGSDSSLRPLINLFTDRLNGVDFEKASRLQAARYKSPVWTYYYNYRANHSLSEFLSGSTRNLGVCHGDDFHLLVNTHGFAANPNDVKVRQLLLGMFESYATQGKPRISGVKWQPLDPDKTKFQFLRLSSPTNVTMDTRSNFAQKNFWNTIDFDENKISSTP